MPNPKGFERATGVAEASRRCTNPACRRWFRVCSTVDEDRCPYCGGSKPEAQPVPVTVQPK